VTRDHLLHSFIAVELWISSDSDNGWWLFL